MLKMTCGMPNFKIRSPKYEEGNPALQKMTEK
jgi:hypothetical protein